VRIDSSGDRLRILRPDGRKRERRGSDGALVELRCEWKDGSLVVESKSERGLKVRETYTPVQAGRVLAVSRRIGGGPFRYTIVIRSRYDLVDAEAAPEGEESPAAGPRLHPPDPGSRNRSSLSRRLAVTGALHVHSGIRDELGSILGSRLRSSARCHRCCDSNADYPGPKRLYLRA
jgi:hypothetical protein